MTPNRRGHMASYIRRRKFLATLLGGAAAWPLAAGAQQPAGKIVSIGILAIEDLPIGLKVDVILTWGIEAALAAKQATTTIPIVMGAAGDPVGSGIVTSLARPAANVTGFSSLSLSVELEAKRLELLKEAVPGLSRVAVLFTTMNRYMPLGVDSARRGAEMLRAS